VAIRVRGKVKINLGSKIEKKVDIFLIFVFKASPDSKSNFLSVRAESKKLGCRLHFVYGQEMAADLFVAY
jgi:hypothetical protein